MRNVLNYYYNLSFDEIKEYSEYAILRKDANIYIFKKFIQNEEETKEIANILLQNNIPAHLIVINNKGEMLTDYNNDKYILILLKNVDIILNDDFFYIEVPSSDNNMAKMWERKIDYYSRQVRELALGKDLLINSFNYYVGMAENAIAMYNQAWASPGDVKFSISHRRIGYPNYAINYLDITNMLIDVRIRDISEYIKAKFFTDDVNVDEIDGFITRFNLSEKEIKLLYARLFYPTYYFDLFESIILGERDEQEILSLLNKRVSYEQFLDNIFNYFKEVYPLYEVEWIKKRT